MSIQIYFATDYKRISPLTYVNGFSGGYCRSKFYPYPRGKAFKRMQNIARKQLHDWMEDFNAQQQYRKA